MLTAFRTILVDTFWRAWTLQKREINAVMSRIIPASLHSPKKQWTNSRISFRKPALLLLTNEEGCEWRGTYQNFSRNV
jgi:hypothetical protein